MKQFLKEKGYVLACIIALIIVEAATALGMGAIGFYFAGRAIAGQTIIEHIGYAMYSIVCFGGALLGVSLLIAILIQADEALGIE